jgi:uncharacterized membrane protein YkvA (DUF1232 family)
MPAMLVLLFTILYILSPIDLIPDWILPGIGWLDDGVMLIVCVALMKWLGGRGEAAV